MEYVAEMPPVYYTEGACWAGQMDYGSHPSLTKVGILFFTLNIFAEARD